MPTSTEPTGRFARKLGALKHAVGILCAGSLLVSPLHAHVAQATQVHIHLAEKGVLIEQKVPWKIVQSIAGTEAVELESIANIITSQIALSAAGETCSSEHTEVGMDQGHHKRLILSSEFQCASELAPVTIQFHWLNAAPDAHVINAHLRIGHKQKYVLVEAERPSISIDVPKLTKALNLNK